MPFKRTPPRSWWPDGGRPQGGGGWGGGKPPPEPHLLGGLTRRTEGRRILSAQKAPAGRFSGSKYNPNTLTRMPPTQYPLSGKAAPPPNSRDAFPSLQQGADPLGWAQGDPREPQGTQGYLRDGPTGPLGVIPKPFRMEPRFDWKVFTKGRPFLP